MKETIIRQLESIFGENNSYNLHEIRSKDGVYVYRVFVNGEPIVVKYFANDEFKREIGIYRLLQSLDIPTIKVLGFTDSCICLEDICSSKTLRLGVPEDLEDEYIACLIAKWYRRLHDNSALAKNSASLCRESDVITVENIQLLRQKLPLGAKVWELVFENYGFIQALINSMDETLTYNDFYWTNLIVSKNTSHALMFDYNLLGRSYRYSDIRNVCFSLSTSARKAFLSEYGNFNRTEIQNDECISVLADLIRAFKKETFPSWANKSLEAVNNGKLLESVKRLLE